MIIIIAAMTEDGVIGKDGNLPWQIPEEMKLFKNLTTGNSVVMGRKTFESIGKPLPDRNNVIISTSMDNRIDCDVCGTVEHGILKAKTYGKDVFVIGGATIYERTLPMANKMYLSYVKKPYEGDTKFPSFDKDEWELEHREDHADFVLMVYKRKEEAK